MTLINWKHISFGIKRSRKKKKRRYTVTAVKETPKEES